MHIRYRQWYKIGPSQDFMADMMRMDAQSAIADGEKACTSIHSTPSPDPQYTQPKSRLEKSPEERSSSWGTTSDEIVDPVR